MIVTYPACQRDVTRYIPYILKIYCPDIPINIPVVIPSISYILSGTQGGNCIRVNIGYVFYVILFFMFIHDPCGQEMDREGIIQCDFPAQYPFLVGRVSYHTIRMNTPEAFREHFPVLV